MMTMITMMIQILYGGQFGIFGSCCWQFIWLGYVFPFVRRLIEIPEHSN